MKYSIPIIRMLLFFFLAIGLITGHVFADTTEDAVIIKIDAINKTLESGVRLIPPEITVEKNTIVIWVNFIDGPEINIEFNAPDAVADATKDLKGFYIDDDKRFTAKYMPFIATASIRFIKNGEFSYSILSQDGKEAATGKVFVK